MVTFEFTEMIPMSFQPYDSRVTDVIVTLSDDSEEYYVIRNKLIEKFNSVGIQAYPDNKCVYVLSYLGTQICIGFRDWTLVIGFNYEKSWL
jgi:hypothetical protein